jgi:hypothetical protein
LGFNFDIFLFFNAAQHILVMVVLWPVGVPKSTLTAGLRPFGRRHISPARFPLRR